MAQQVNMAGMGSVGGPVGGPVGGSVNAPNMMSTGSNDPAYHARQLNTYIYDYFLKNGHFELARMVNSKLDTTNPDVKRSPRRDVNGVNDGMDDDSKDSIHKIPDDLPRPKLPSTGNDNSFLLDWWSQFWDVFSAQRNRIKGPAQVYLQHSHGKNRLQQQQQQQMLRQMDPNMMGANMANYKMMPQNANAAMMQNELRQRAFANQRNAGQNLQQMANMRQQQQLQQSGQMQRDGSAMGMGQDRPQSPGGSVENAPSPKRQRLDGNGFNGPMGPAGRGQPQGMQGQGISSVPGMQGSPMNGQQTTDMSDYYVNNRMPPGMGGPGQQTGNHALQDYQMQLMLLEQQNKKRLLMARQEQDNNHQIGLGGPGPAGPGQGMQQGYPQGMSPQARPGPSPGPGDQMKRGTPKMGQSPLPDGTMPQQGSPAPSFDPQMPHGMPPQFYSQIKAQEGMPLGPTGQMMRPPSSNPAFAGAQLNPEQMQQLQRQRQQAANMQNGMNFAQGGPPNMVQQPQPGQQGQQPPGMGTPQQRSNMPPPPAPATGGEAANRTQPSSPAQTPNQPPTPSQTAKSNPKKKAAGKDNKKQANKKTGAAAGATPATEQEPPTPTPPTPITPMHQNSFGPGQQKNGVGAQQQQQPNANAGQPPAAAAPQQQPQPDPNMQFADISGTDLSNFEFGPLTGPEADVLQDFDFDSFLQPDGNEHVLPFDGSFSFGPDALEAGTGE